MHFALDVDETLFSAYHAFGTIPGPGFGKVTGKHDVPTWESLYDTLGGLETALTVFRAAGMWEVMGKYDPIAHSVDVLHRLHDAGAEFTVMSDRNPDTRESMIRWLDTHDIPYTNIYCEAMPDKIRVCRELGIDAIIDDKPLTLEMAAKAGMFATGLRGPYNEQTAADNNIELGYNWLEIEQVILQKYPDLARVVEMAL